MTDLAARDLRNDVSSVLRRVETGERFRVTVSGRPVAELVSLPVRHQSMPWTAFQRHLDGALADPALSDELAELLPDSTDHALE